MTVSAIAHSKFVDRAAYDGYQTEFLVAFAQFKGTLQVADAGKVVLMSFPDRAAFTAWAESSDYTIVLLVGDCRISYPKLFMRNDSHDAFVAQRRIRLYERAFRAIGGPADSAVDAHAAVDVNRLTGQVRGVVAYEEGHHGSDVLTDAADSLEWHRTNCTFEVLRSDVLPELYPG